MVANIKQKIKLFLNDGHERSLKIKRNIIYTVLIKGASVLIGFLLLPLTLGYLNPVQYGIWINIISIVTWINTFDVGLGNGLRNKLTRAVALNEQDVIKKSISTTYASLFVIAVFAFLLFATVGSFFNWNNLFKLNRWVDYNIWPLVLITFGGFAVQFILRPLNTILIATHQNFKSSLLLLLGQALTFIGVFLLKQFTAGNLYLLVFVAMGAPILVYIVAHIYFFSGPLKGFAPGFRFIDRKMARSLFSTGGAFFCIQIGAMVLYETDTILITRQLGPASVTVFNVAYKYFWILTVTFSIIIAPFWSAFADAFAKNDFVWIKTTMRKMRRIWILFFVAAMVLYLFSGVLYRVWLRDNTVVVPHLLSFTVALYTVFQIWTDMHTYLLNGTGKLRIQLILVIITGLLNIPLSIWLISKVGVSGTVIANGAVILLMNIFFTYQANLIINQKARGIWNR